MKYIITLLTANNHDSEIKIRSKSGPNKSVSHRSPSNNAKKKKTTRDNKRSTQDPYERSLNNQLEYTICIYTLIMFGQWTVDTDAEITYILQPYAILLYSTQICSLIL